MKISYLILTRMFLVLGTLYGAQGPLKPFIVTETPTAEQITSTSYLINSPTFPKGAEFSYLNPFKEFLAYKSKLNKEVLRLNTSTHSPSLSLNYEDILALTHNPELCTAFVLRFFRYTTLIFSINALLDLRYQDCGQDGICCNNNLGFIASKLKDPYLIELLLFFNRIQTEIAAYQQKHIPTLFSLITDPQFYKMVLKYHKKMELPEIILLIARSCAGLRNMYIILVNSIFLAPVDKCDLPDHICQFFNEQELKLRTFYLAFDHTSHLQHIVQKRLLTTICKESHRLEDCRLKHLFGENNFLEFDAQHNQLVATFSDEFKRAYRKVFNTATSHQKDLKLTIPSSWSKPIIIPIRYNLSSITHIPLGIFEEVEHIVHESAKAIEAKVKTLMKELQLEDTVPDKQQSSSKTPSRPKGAAAAQREKAKEAFVSAASTALPESFSIPPSGPLYTFNTHLSHKSVELDTRISEWYKGTGKDNVAIVHQGYLTQGTDRNRILEETIRQAHGNRKQAIESIIFRHQLPISLIRTIMTYGNIAQDSTKAHTQVSALVYAAMPGDAPSYYQAEITGKVTGKIFQIWHSFLRPIDNIDEFMENTLEGHISSLSAADNNDESSDFTILGEDKGWATDDQEASVRISKGDTQYILFKQ